MARAAASPPPSRPAPPSPSPRTSTPIGAHPQSCSAGHLPAPSHSATTPPPPSPIRLCSRRGCTSPVHPLCSTGYCDSHCQSHRCPQHRPSVPQPLSSCSPASHMSCFWLLFSSSFHLFCGLLLHSLHQSEVSATLSSSGAAPLPTS